MELPANQTQLKSAPMSQRSAANWTVAKQLESVFLSEMMKATEQKSSPFGSGAPSEFGSFLRTAQVDAMSDAGGIGLARQLFEAMERKSL